MGWNVQGKSLADVASAWPTLGLGGSDFLGLQEVGGLKDLSKPWDTMHVEFDEPWTFYCTNPPKTWRAVLLGMPSRNASNVEAVIPLDVGICVILKSRGCRQFVISAHLPHRQREDCLACWQGFLHQLDHILRKRRFQDLVVCTVDTNYELGSSPASGSTSPTDEREVYSQLLLRDHGFVHTRPETFTWCNTRGSSSKIDFVLLSSPKNVLHHQYVSTESNYLLGSRHRAVSASFDVLGGVKPVRPHRTLNKCGKWTADPSKVFLHAQTLCHRLDLGERDLTCADLENLATRTCFRPKSYRYKDPPEILNKISQRRRLGGREARELGKEIVRLRAVAKNLWLTSILDKSANGDFRAISYFRRRQNVLSSHNNYLVRAGGKTKAIHDLKAHFKTKWTEPDVITVSPLALLFSGSNDTLQKPPMITAEEVCTVLATCRPGKSCGQDGVSYELLQLVMQTECSVHLVDMFNSVLFQTSPIPPEWLSSKLTLLPKVPCPSSPSELRPIVFSSTPGKLFSKILLMRLRSSFPAPVANQLCGIPGSQTLDGSCCLQHVVRLSQEFGLPLIAVKSDISSAFDNISHQAFARYFSRCGARLESYMLLSMIVASSVNVSIADASWTQALERGILQGSPYSAEIFARTLDFYLGALTELWFDSEDTWLQSLDPGGKFRKIFTLLYADDLILLATSHAQATRMLQQVIATFGAIGLKLSLGNANLSLLPVSLVAPSTPPLSPSLRFPLLSF